MKQLKLPYHIVKPPRAVSRARLDNIALVPASLLPLKGTYQPVANSLPQGSVLLCDAPTKPRLQAVLANWELVSCTYLLVSLQSPVFQPASTEPASPQAAPVPTLTDRFCEHRWWDPGQGWKNILNNLRLILQPYVFHCLLPPWLLLFDIPGLLAGFLELIGIMNLFHAVLPT